MLWALFVVLFLLWLLGVSSDHMLGGFVHVLLALAAVTLLFQWITRVGPEYQGSGLGRGRTGLSRKSGTSQEVTMNKDELEGKAKDIAGRAQRQVGEWTGDEKTQAEGGAKQVEGKVQNAWGKIKKEAEDMTQKVRSNDKPSEDVADADDEIDRDVA